MGTGVKTWEEPPLGFALENPQETYLLLWDSSTPLDLLRIEYEKVVKLGNPSSRFSGYIAFDQSHLGSLVRRLLRRVQEGCHGE